LLPVQTPVWQESDWVHLSPSSQAPVLTGFEQTPVVVLHVPALWHWSLALHTIGLLPVQTPVWHVSLCVHLLPSLQATPSVLLGFEQTPVVLSQLPTLWHWSLAEHVTGLAPTHLPALQLSLLVHAFPSSQVVPAATGTALQAPVTASHVPALHASLSAEQSTAVPPTHLPAARSQVRPTTHGSVLHWASAVQAHLLKS
jgi:hypothetical protein